LDVVADTAHQFRALALVLHTLWPLAMDGECREDILACHCFLIAVVVSFFVWIFVLPVDLQIMPPLLSTVTRPLVCSLLYMNKYTTSSNY
jgi:hypothetical protein